MAKPYNYMTNAEYSTFSFGVLIKPHCGVVETTWKIPTKYQELAEKWIYDHTYNAIQPAIQINALGIVTFNHHIDFSQIFVDLEGSNLDKYNQVITMRDEAINEACYQLLRAKESFQDMIRGKFYTQRFVDNAPSIP
jgi:hypothetical protein